MLKERFSIARHLVEKEIISNNTPDDEIDLTGVVKLSAQLLGDYVNLDWQHRSDIVALINRIAESSAVVPLWRDK